MVTFYAGDVNEQQAINYDLRDKTDSEVELYEARNIIADLICSKISYMLVNNLGDPFKQQDIRRAVRFLMEEE